MPGTPIGAPHIKVGQLDGMKTIGLVARAGNDAPRGTYELGFSNGELTFTDVMLPTAPIVEGAQSYSIPFVKIATADASCHGDCSIGSISLDWNKLTPTGWQRSSVQPARLEIVLKRGTQKTNLAANLTGASINWQDFDLTNTGILPNELGYFTTANICYVGVTYDSELGMKMTNDLYNPGCF
jgi:hypothetical protein